MSDNGGTIWTAVGAIATVAGVLVAVLAWQSPHQPSAPTNSQSPSEASANGIVQEHRTMDMSTNAFHNGDLIRLTGPSADQSWDFRLTPNGTTGHMMLQTSSAKTANIGDQPPSYQACHSAEYSSEDIYTKDAVGKWMCVQTKDGTLVRMHVDDATDDAITIHVEGWL